MGQWRRLKGVNGDLGIKYANNNKKDILKKSTAKSLSRGNVPVTVANPQTSLWTVFTETVLYWRNSPYKLSKYNVLRIGNKNTVLTVPTEPSKSQKVFFFVLVLTRFLIYVVVSLWAQDNNWLIKKKSSFTISRLRYLNNLWMDSEEICYRHSWSFMENKFQWLLWTSDFSYGATLRSAVCCIDWNVLTTVDWWLAVKFGTHIHHQIKHFTYSRKYSNIYSMDWYKIWYRHSWFPNDES